MTQFREGDIVRGPRGEVGRITALSVYGEAIIDGAWDIPAARLTLLRRPVRVGDTLRSHGSATVRVVSEVSHTGVAFACGDSHGLLFQALYPANQYGWTHADGTPIEPPKAEEKPAPSAVAIQALYEAQQRMVLGFDPADRADAYAVAHVITKTQPPTVEQIARALFETDSRVIAFVDRVSDWAPPGQGHMAMRCSDDPRWSRAMQLAWERNEGHWRDDAEQRASEIRAVLLQSEGK